MVKPPEVEETPQDTLRLVNNNAAPNKALPSAAATATSSSGASEAALPQVTSRKGYAHLFKYVVVGDSGSGKTALVRRYCKDSFDDARIYTIGVDFDIKTVSLPNGDEIKLQIWDTAGQERFRTITTSYYRGATGIILVYDVNDVDSFNNLRPWMQEVQRYCNEDARIIIVGTKMDQWDGSGELYTKEKFRQVIGLDDASDDEESWMSYGIAGFYQTSAKTGDNVDKAFQALTDQLVAERLNQKNPLRVRVRIGAGVRSKGSDTSSEYHDGYHLAENSVMAKSMSRSGCCLVM